MFFDLNCLAEKGSAPNLISEMKPPLLRLVEGKLGIAITALGNSRINSTDASLSFLSSFCFFFSTWRFKNTRISSNGKSPRFSSILFNASSKASETQRFRFAAAFNFLTTFSVFSRLETPISWPLSGAFFIFLARSNFSESGTFCFICRCLPCI